MNYLVESLLSVNCFCIFVTACLAPNNFILFNPCRSPTTFKPSDIQRLVNSPSQNGSDSLLAVYASYPDGKIVPKEILTLVLLSQLSSIEGFTGLQLSIEYTPTPPPEPTATQNRSAVGVSLTNYDMSQVRYFKVKLCINIIYRSAI